MLNIHKKAHNENLAKSRENFNGDNTDKYRFHNKQQTLNSSDTDSDASQNKNEKKNYNTQRIITLKLFELLRKSEIGGDKFFLGPYGYKRNYTASGRPISFIEDFINNRVLTNYANTHSTGTNTAAQSTKLRDEAREIIRKSVNAKDDCNVLFVGSGSTAAIHKLIGLLNLTEPPVVIVSPYEHHSNLLPWKEIGAEFIYATDSAKSSIDLDDLEKKLMKYKNDKRVKIGSFTSASNVTGILLDTEKIAILLHKYQFLSFWDYSTAAPHVTIDMHPNNPLIEDSDLAYKDAVFFSGHKFIGGPQTPGVLIARKDIFKNQVPINCGGGTVFYVTKKKHCYLNKNEEREEGGTPAIIESIRLGLVFKLKDALDHDVVMEQEIKFAKKGLEFLKKIPNLVVLGNLKIQRLPIFTFLIKHEQSGYYLHYNFVTALLNDLFGIQSRSGCACAGPYGQYLLGISDELAEAYIQFLYKQDKNSPRHDWNSNDYEMFKPGFTRFNLVFFLENDRVNFILHAIKFVAEHGWKFLPFYDFDIKSGSFKHIKSKLYKDKNSLNDLNFSNGDAEFEKISSVINCPIANDDPPKPKTSEDVLRAALNELEKTKQPFDIADQRLYFKPHTKRFRWFLLPSEAYGYMHNNTQLYDINKVEPPFIPHSLGGENFNKSDSTNSKPDKKKDKDFDSSSKHPYLRKINTKIKKNEVALYLKLSKLKENLSCK